MGDSMRNIDISNNNSHKLFAGILALVIVAGMTVPAFAQELRAVTEPSNGMAFPPVCPSDCESVALEHVYEIDPYCLDVEFDSICEEELEIYTAICLETADDGLCPIGGTVGSMSTTTLLVAGAQSEMGLWSIALVGAVAVGAIAYKVRANKPKQ